MSISDEKVGAKTNNDILAPVVKKEDNVKGKLFKITINNYDEEIIQNLKNLCLNSPLSHNLKYYIGFEIGEQGTPHIQGYLRFPKETRRTTIKAYIGTEFYCALVKKGRNQTIEDVDEDMVKYCSKDKNERNFTNIEGEIDVEVLEYEQFRPFQKELLKYTTDPTLNGKVTWVYDEVGQLGKTEFLRHYGKYHNGMFTYGGKCSDIINLVYNNKDKIIKKRNNCLIFNLGRDTDPRKISYKSMEQVMDGCICNTKFEAGSFITNKINIIVLANCLPLFDKMTQSRWNIKTIDKDFNLINWVKPANDYLIEDSNDEYEL